jgi:hypothetical protein
MALCRIHHTSSASGTIRSASIFTRQWIRRRAVSTTHHPYQARFDRHRFLPGSGYGAQPYPPHIIHIRHERRFDMADNWQAKLEASAGKLAEQIQSALNLNVVTYTTDIHKPDNDPDKKRMVAETVLAPLGDVTQALPVQFKNDEIIVNKDLNDAHIQAVNQAILARKDMLNYARDLLKDVKGLLSD